MMQNSIILVGGPTASGKSALAMRLARGKNGSIINADAMQVYKGLPILPAQPDPQDRADIPHLLYETTDAAEASSAGKWLAQARAAIAQTRAQGRTPILVGGTGLYFDALTKGLADIPSIPDDIRAESAKLYAEWGEAKFREVLAQRDPESASRIARNDRQRLIRAYEVIDHTGKTLGEWQKGDSGFKIRDSGKSLSFLESRGPNPEFSFECHLLLPPREQLYAACDKRFLRMIERGAIEEVKNLIARNLPPAPVSSTGQVLPAMKILGVREIAAYLRGEMSLDAAIAKAQQLTRNYAKRQTTWFGNKWAKSSHYGKLSINENRFLA